MTDTRRKISSRTILVMLDALRAKPRTAAQLAEIAGLGVDPVRSWLRDMRDSDLGRICDYAEDARGRKFTPVWELGTGRDAPRPGTRQTAAERMARTRARRRAVGETPAPPVRKKPSGIGLDDLL